MPKDHLGATYRRSSLFMLRPKQELLHGAVIDRGSVQTIGSNDVAKLLTFLVVLDC